MTVGQQAQTDRTQIQILILISQWIRTGVSQLNLTSLSSKYREIRSRSQAATR